MKRPLAALLIASVLSTHSGCALRSTDVVPLRADPGEFVPWGCERILEESGHVQRQAARVAYAFDERAGNNIVAMGIGLMVFWPAMLAMRPVGPDATVLAALKGRYEALQAAAASKGCPPPSNEPSRPWLASLPVAVGDELRYEQRLKAGAPAQSFGLRVQAIRTDQITLSPVAAPGAAAGLASDLWQHDLAGNLKQSTLAPIWPELLREDLSLGQMISGELRDPGDAQQMARVRGQVVAVGPQEAAGQRFDVAVIELFGDASNGMVSTRLDGVLVVDRASGVLLRLDLYSSHPVFQMQRRLVRLSKAP